MEEKLICEYYKNLFKKDIQEYHINYCKETFQTKNKLTFL